MAAATNQRARAARDLCTRSSRDPHRAVSQRPEHAARSAVPRSDAVATRTERTVRTRLPEPALGDTPPRSCGDQMTHHGAVWIVRRSCLTWMAELVDSWRATSGRMVCAGCCVVVVRWSDWLWNRCQQPRLCDRSDRCACVVVAGRPVSPAHTTTRRLRLALSCGARARVARAERRHDETRSYFANTASVPGARA